MQRCNVEAEASGWEEMSCKRGYVDMGAECASREAPADEQKRFTNAYTSLNKQTTCLVRAIRRILGRSCVSDPRVRWQSRYNVSLATVCGVVRTSITQTGAKSIVAWRLRRMAVNSMRRHVPSPLLCDD